MATTGHFADRLVAAAGRAGSAVCVGLDPVEERLPAGETVASFCLGVIEAVAGVVPAVKPQLACFERYGSEGWAWYERIVAAAKEAGLLVIADAKRGDIGLSSSHYAAGLLAGDRGADAVTVSPYLGSDGLEPFVEVAQREGKGLFVLVRTSNPGGTRLQGLELRDGRTVAEAVADLVAELGRSSVGACGYSSVGAVVGATHPADARALRARMPEQVFLVPGFGAQGGGAEAVAAVAGPSVAGGFRGAVVTASRSVLYAYEDAPHEDWRAAVRAAAEQLVAEVRAAGG